VVVVVVCGLLEVKSAGELVDQQINTGWNLCQSLFVGYLALLKKKDTSRRRETDAKPDEEFWRWCSDGLQGFCGWSEADRWLRFLRGGGEGWANGA
jgi:hypothetical protein